MASTWWPSCNWAPYSGTLERAASSDWSTIAPVILCYRDLDGRTQAMHPITERAMPLEHLLVSSSITALSQVDSLFADCCCRLRACGT